MGYGLSPYGLSPYGGTLSVVTINLVAAWAISTHGVRVLLTSEPTHADQFAVGDALNPETWSVVDVTTGRELTVVAVLMHDSTSVDLTTLEALGDHLDTHVVTAIALLSSTGVIVTAPADAEFAGVVQTMDPVESVSLDDYRDRDLANPPFQIARTTGYAGTLIISDDGDFATESGSALIRKLVLRRLNTPLGSFRWLPNYGLELREKEPIGSGDLVGLLRRAELQAKQEPDVKNAVVRGSINRAGTLIIQVSIEASGGATINMRMGSVAGRLVEI